MFRVLFILFLMVFVSPAFAISESETQQKLDEIGQKILNANKIDKRIIFTYDPQDKLIKGMSEVTKREIIIYPKTLLHAVDDNEIAAVLARSISVSRKSYDGSLGGWVSAAQVKFSPKKYELVSDRRAVEYLVNAGYNPIALITLINKSCPQARQDRFSSHNLTSKRLMYIYEKIYFDYPWFIKNNEYIDYDSYQNFLLSSVENRKKLEEMARYHERGRAKYE